MLRKMLSILEEKRAAKPLPRGIAPYTSSTLFKIHGSDPKPKAKLWDHRFSLESQDQRTSTLKEAARTLDPSSIISLGTGRPDPEYFPWSSILLHGSYNSCSKGTKSATPVPAMSCTKGEIAYDLSVALNYGFAAGSPQILRFITEHVEMIHNPPYNDWESCMTCGTTSAIDIALRMFCNRGEWILVEDHTYSGTIDAAKNQGLNILGVRMDNLGLLPDDLDLKLQTWNPAIGKKPFLLYTIPSGQNPTGTTQTTERRKAIYRVAEKHDLYILEDDPYYFLVLDDSTREFSAVGITPSLADKYLDRLPVSYLSLDESGRVLRMDSTSKILSPGLRCGWMTGCTQVTQKFLACVEVSLMSPSGPSQAMLYKLLDETWGHEGFINWLSHLSMQYSQRRHILVEACERQLPSELCEWVIPRVGMFLWLRLDMSKHPVLQPDHCHPEGSLPQNDIEDSIYKKARENGVLISKGSWFTTKEAEHRVCFRMTFAAAPHNFLDQAVSRFGRALREEFQLD